MGLFSFKKVEEPVIKTLNDLFTFKFDSVPDESFIVSKQLNTEGIEVQQFRKILSHKECGIFDTMEVILIPPEQKNIILSTTDIRSVSISDVRKIVDTVFLFLGTDGDIKGRFDSEDKEQFNRGLFWSRMWIEEKHPFHVMISLSPPTFEMSLLGINRI